MCEDDLFHMLQERARDKKHANVQDRVRFLRFGKKVVQSKNYRFSDKGYGLVKKVVDPVMRSVLKHTGSPTKVMILCIVRFSSDLFILRRKVLPNSFKSVESRGLMASKWSIDMRSSGAPPNTAQKDIF